MAKFNPSKLYYLLSSLIVGLLLITCAPLNIRNGGRLNGELNISSKEDEEMIVDYSDFKSILNKAGCQDFQAYVWNYIYKIVSIENGKPPPYYTVKKTIIKRIQELMKEHPASKEDIQKFALRFVEIYALVTEFMNTHQEDETTTTLVQFEHGVVEQSHTDFINKLTQTFEELDENAKALNQGCKEEEIYADTDDTNNTDSSHSSDTSTDSTSSSHLSEWDIAWFHKMRKSVHPLVYGARKVMSTAYQSCSVLDLELMPVDYNTKGIRASSRHPSGNGWRRVVTSLRDVNNTHYYLSQIDIPNNNQCTNVHSTPLIYDYGGKPSTSMSSINLFRNSGSGSKSLGVDCSGFVTSAMASAGLRLKQKVFIRPIHVKGINSWMFKTAERNKLSCLKQQDITVQNPIQPGDIIASNSHVFIVEFTGRDPFGLNNITNSDQCHSKTVKLSNFQFSIIQSSAHNNGVGINRMHIRDAADGLHTIKRGLQRIASRACYKIFGMETHININEISIVRHSSKVPACRDREIYLENQECLKTCEPEYTTI